MKILIVVMLFIISVQLGEIKLVLQARFPVASHCPGITACQ